MLLWAWLMPFIGVAAIVSFFFSGRPYELLVGIVALVLGIAIYRRHFGQPRSPRLEASGEVRSMPGSLFQPREVKAVGATLPAELVPVVTKQKASSSMPEHVSVAVDIAAARSLFGRLPSDLEGLEDQQVAEALYKRAASATALPVYVSVFRGSALVGACSRSTRRQSTRTTEPPAHSPRRDEAATALRAIVHVEYESPTTASVTFRFMPDARDDEMMEDLVRMVPHLYAKVLFELESGEAADLLLDYGDFLGRALSAAAAGAGDDGLVTATVLPPDIELAHVRPQVPVATCEIELHGKSGVEDSYGVITRYVGSEAALYAARSIGFVAESIVSNPCPWSIPGGIGLAILEMNNRYRSEPGCWTTLDAMRLVPARALTKASKYFVAEEE